MKMFSALSLKSIRVKMERVGVTMTDAQFNGLTYGEMKKIYRKARRAYGLYEQIDAIINKPKAPTPEIPKKN
jgi:hypothetical protein